MNKKDLRESKELLLPARIIVGRNSTKIEFPHPNKWGYALKIMLRNIARKLDLYHLPIKTEPEVKGMTDRGDEISINTLGRWTFGTPGYMGHIICDGGIQDRIIVYVPDIPEVQELISQATAKLVSEK